MKIDIHHSDCLAWLAAYDGPLFDSCVTDPPYHLTSIVKRYGKDGAAPAKRGKGKSTTGAYARASRGFMGKEWDGGDIAFRPETWRAIYERLKPGAHLVAFSGTRTYHRMACAIEDAGFEIRDQLQWLYGSGFPKSHDVGKGIDRHNGDVREKVKIENPRIANIPSGPGETRPWLEKAFEQGFHEKDGPSAASAAWQGWGTALKPAAEPICLARKPLSEKSIAANVLKHGTGAINVDACRVASDEENRRPSNGGENGLIGSGTFKIRARTIEEKAVASGRFPANVVHDGSDEVLAGFPETQSGKLQAHHKRSQPKKVNTYGDWADGAGDSMGESIGDSGSAARFFYSAKAGPLDRIGTAHPTVKPIDLMRWLCKLITPPGGHILEPFAGSGKTLIAAMAEGFDCTGIDIEADHVADIERQLAYLRGDGAMRFAEHNHARAKREKPEDLGGLFA